MKKISFLFYETLNLYEFVSVLVWFSFQYEFTPVPSCGFVFIYM